MSAVATRMTVRAEEIITGDVVMGISTHESFVIEQDAIAYRLHGDCFVVNLVGDNEDGDVRRESGEPEVLMVFAEDEFEIIRGAI